jgi:hypothetical protein
MEEAERTFWEPLEYRICREFAASRTEFSATTGVTASAYPH